MCKNVWRKLADLAINEWQKLQFQVTITPILPHPRGQYSKGLGLRIRGIYLSGSPLGPVQARLFLVPDPVINHCK